MGPHGVAGAVDGVGIRDVAAGCDLGCDLVLARQAQVEHEMAVEQAHVDRVHEQLEVATASARIATRPSMVTVASSSSIVRPERTVSQSTRVGRAGMTPRISSDSRASWRSSRSLNRCRQCATRPVTGAMCCS